MRVKKEIPSSALLSRFLTCCANTGRLHWRARPRSMFPSDSSMKSWNSRRSGTDAGAVGSNGYRVVKLLGKSYRAHVLVWAMHYGSAPDYDIDHINGDRSDNRISNLRQVTHSINMRNTQVSSLNTSGVPGVGWHSGTQKWVARIHNMNSKRISLGYFDNFEDAIAARKNAERRLGYHQNHGRRVAA